MNQINYILLLSKIFIMCEICEILEWEREIKEVIQYCVISPYCIYNRERERVRGEETSLNNNTY